MTNRDVARNAARDARILAAATVLAHGSGLTSLTRRAIATAASMSPATVSNFQCSQISARTEPPEPLMTRVVTAVLRAAVEAGDLAILAQGLGLQHPVALEAPHALRVAALTAVGGADA